MIKIYIDNYDDIANWYCSKILNDLLSRKSLLIQYLQTNIDNFLCHKKIINKIINIINSISINDLRNILLEPFDSLKNKYNYIKFYIYLVNKFLTYNTKYIEPKDSFIRYINSAIKEMFDYSFIDDVVKLELVNKLNIRICPYCNRQFIQPITVVGKIRYICDLDHIKPKLKYPLFSMSIWNLLPSCKPCNQAFKNQHDTEILSPYEDGFNDDVIFKINYKDANSFIGLSDNMDFFWEFSNNISTKKFKLCNNNLDLFKLNEVYTSNKREIKNILRKRYYLSNAYKSSLDKIKDLKALFDEKTYYGVNLDPREFQNEILSKAIYDVIYNN